jgi:hypothetical protein
MEVAMMRDFFVSHFRHPAVHFRHRLVVLGWWLIALTLLSLWALPAFSGLAPGPVFIGSSDPDKQTVDCVEASDFYQSPQSGLHEIFLGPVKITEALDASGAAVPLAVADCSQDGGLDVGVPWSEDTAMRLAAIEFSPNLCHGNAPQIVEIVLEHGNHCVLHARNDAGGLVDSVTAAAHSAPQALLLSSRSGIRFIQIEGSEICILRICWACECQTTDDCAEAGDVFSFAATSLPEVNLGWVTFTQAISAAGGPVPLNVVDCSQDGHLDVQIPWSGETAKEKATIEFSKEVCCGKGPEVVEVILQHGNSCVLYALNDAGGLVDAATAAPHPAPQSLSLESQSGIRTIWVGGSEICVLRVCWKCMQQVPPTPTPTETLSPTPTPTNTPHGFLPDPLWVDASNTSGTEDGSVEFPFDTIAEAMMASITHTIIRVRGGEYHESIVLRDGVKLIGSGAGRSIIYGDVGGPLKNGIGAGVSCIGVGPGTLVAGFTITGASVGVYCLSSSPAITNNVITSIALGSLGGDGIRLDDSSPLIQNNVIYHVGGMGIRAQGASQPHIVNNTIYDYRYYAAISFAALNIGAVTPTIKNNIIVRGNSEPVGGILWRLPCNPIVSYNDVFDPANVTGGGSFYAYHDGAMWHEASGGQGAISASPEFENSGIGSFYLLPGSPGIDAGDPAPEYNDFDGSRNDMGAYGGLSLDPGGSGHPGNGFIFTSVGKIPVTEIVQDSLNPSYGLAVVSVTAANDFSIPQYKDSPFGGSLWIRGLFGSTDPVDYYQVFATPEGSTESIPIDDPLSKVRYTIHPDGTVTHTTEHLGPQTIGGVPNLYELNKEGYWSHEDLRIIWNTTGLNGRYHLTYQAYMLTGTDTVAAAVLPPNTLDHLAVYVDNTPLSLSINDIKYADGTSIAECESIIFPHNGSSELIFNITAHHPTGFLHNYVLDCAWGHNHYGGRFAYDQYEGVHDVPPPYWSGVIDLELPPLPPVDSLGDPVPWENCAYGFQLYALLRTTDGYNYLRSGLFTSLHSVETISPKAEERRVEGGCADCPATTSPGTESPPLDPPPVLPPEPVSVKVEGSGEKVVPGDTVWVDDDNLGFEDGTEGNPFNTIGEGITEAAPGQQVRVLPGTYPETVNMKDGVPVIGSGADATVIVPASGEHGVDCIAVGAGTVLSGFTINGGSLGVYCVSGNPAIRENVITNANYSSLTADGIRLDNASPVVTNNVIYHVGGMGIRAQGISEPHIINNTIYDYGYYAGISFAALNIGAVQPVIKNNIVARGNTAPVGGILWRVPASPLIDYNDVFDPANVTGGGSYYAEHDGVLWHEMPGGTGSLTDNPAFVDADVGYFVPAPGSPCIDAGDPNPIYNDNDGSRNDMGAFGGQLLGAGPSGHLGSGFIFTTIGNVPVTELVTDPGNPSHALLVVDPTAAADFHIPQYADSPLGGNLWLHGLFGAGDDVDYYQILASPYGISATETLSDPLSKINFTINPDGTVTATRIQMGPQTIGGVPDLYLLNKTGYWTFTDLRFIWNTAGLAGKYSVRYRAFRELPDGSVVEVLLPPNEQDHFTIRIDNTPVEVHIDNIAYADHAAIPECEKIRFPHSGDSSLIFTLTAWQPSGFLRYYLLNCTWGNNRYGGQFTYDQYVGSHDITPPTWEGVYNQEFPPLLPRDPDGAVMDWHTCAYRFHLEGSSRVTDGISYLRWSNDEVFQSVVVEGGAETPTPANTPESTPTSTPEETPTSTPVPGATDTPTPVPFEFYDQDSNQEIDANDLMWLLMELEEGKIDESFLFNMAHFWEMQM